MQGGLRPPLPCSQSHPELQGDDRRIPPGDAPPHAVGTSARSRWSLEPSPGLGGGQTPWPRCALGQLAPSRSGVQGEQPLAQPRPGRGEDGGCPPGTSAARGGRREDRAGRGDMFLGSSDNVLPSYEHPRHRTGLWGPSGEGSPCRGGAVTAHGGGESSLGHGWSCCGVARGGWEGWGAHAWARGGGEHPALP